MYKIVRTETIARIEDTSTGKEFHTYSGKHRVEQAVLLIRIMEELRQECNPPKPATQR